MLNLRIGLISIPISTTNFSNSRYASGGLHQFSLCCKEEVGNKNYCKGCGNIVSKEQIVKGIDKNTILSEAQQEALKTYLEGGLIEVLGIKDITETTFYDILPFVVKAQMISPSISKGFRKIDIKTFFSFKTSLKELNKFCIAKLTQRNTEHLGVIMNWKDYLTFFELPFKSYSNMSGILSTENNIKQVIQTEKITDLEGFKSQAEQFISNYKNRIENTDEIEESKAVLLKSLIDEIKTGVKEIKEVEINEVNPFC